jgi:hypothetical protein
MPESTGPVLETCVLKTMDWGSTLAWATASVAETPVAAQGAVAPPPAA